MYASNQGLGRGSSATREGNSTLAQRMTMPITYSIDRENRIIEEKWTGTVTREELADYWVRYLGDPEVLDIRRTLVDLRESDITFIGSEMENLVQSLVLPALKGRDWKTAIVVSEPLQFGVSRQYQVFAERYSKDAIFDDINEAKCWLLARK